MSHVLEAMQVPASQAMGTLRLSTGRMTTEAEVEEAAREIAEGAEALKQHAGHALPGRGEQ